MAYLPDGQCRVLIAPCGCFGAGDISDDIPGFGRTIDMAREDIRDGFTETQTTIEEWRAKSLGCTHTPKWRAPMTRQTVPDVWHEAGHGHCVTGDHYATLAPPEPGCPDECQEHRDKRAQALTEAQIHAANVGDE